MKNKISRCLHNSYHALCYATVRLHIKLLKDHFFIFLLDDPNVHLSHSLYATRIFFQVLKNIWGAIWLHSAGMIEAACYCLSLFWAKMIWPHWSIVSVTHDLFPMAQAVCFVPSVPGSCKFLLPLFLSKSHIHTNLTCMLIQSYVQVPLRMGTI